MTKKIIVFFAAGLLAVTALHYWYNHKAATEQGGDAAATAKLQVGFLPVTCHLTCPVTHYINENLKGPVVFAPKRFSAFPEIVEMFKSNQLEATFILAPLAIKLREQGVPIKIVYLGHRDGTTMMVHKDSDIHKIEDLRGKKIAIPSRFSNQHLIVFRALKERGIGIKEVTLLEMPPPDMPAALGAKAVDAIIAGEPLMAMTELDGYGRVLFMTKDVWPEFISCVLAVNEKVIRDRREEVQRLVNGIAQSGKWIDEKDTDHRMEAAEFVSGKEYYNIDPKLLRFVLSKPPDRVKYTNLSLKRKDFEEIEQLGREAGILEGKAHFDDYADTSFVTDETKIAPYKFEMKK